MNTIDKHLQTPREGSYDTTTVSTQKPPENSVSLSKITSTARKRVRTGCLNCRRKHKKCDEVKPTCTTCSQKNEVCEWPNPRNKNPSKHMDPHNLYLPSSAHLIQYGTPLENFNGQPIDSNLHFKRARIDSESEFSWLTHHQIPYGGPPLTSSQYITPQSQLYSQFNRIKPIEGPGLLPYPWPPNHNPQPMQASQGSHTQQSQCQPEDSKNSLVNGETQGQQPQLSSLLNNEIPSQNSLNMLSSYPSPSPPSLSCTLEEIRRSEYVETQLLKFLMGDKSVVIENSKAVPATAIIPGRELTKYQEVILMKHYLNYVARQYDVFNPEWLNFHLAVPNLVHDHAALKHSIYAISLIHFQTSRNSEESFNESAMSQFEKSAVEFIAEVNARTMSPKVQVITVMIFQGYCIILNKPDLWRRFTEATVRHMQACGFGPNDNDFDSVCLYWAVAMTDINTTTLLEQKPFINIRLEEANNCPNLMHRLLGYLNMTLNLLHLDQQPNFENRWEQLWLALQGLKSELKLTKHRHLEPFIEADDQPFPMLLFSDHLAVLFQQTYIIIKILLIQDMPRLFKNKYPISHPLSWYVKRICAITQWNKEFINWFSTPLSLCVAGKVLTHKDEHSIVLKLLGELEKNIGFKSKYNTEDLIDFWNGRGNI